MYTQRGIKLGTAKAPQSKGWPGSGGIPLSFFLFVFVFLLLSVITLYHLSPFRSER